ncbi:recombinase family protein [Muribaculum intestinale]|uniref:recombinase family protein n=1 Tax=Muribaculum intestinale TaxID=1796646 RepID=UPI0025B65385|nr:recombinase family protein [Muribaculum intestinale]
MAIRIYLRVSTLEQGFDQQMQDIKAYFNANRINMDDVTDIVEEHVSGGKSYEDRKFQQLLNRSMPGDYIYAASTDRLGRNFIDMMRLMEDAKRRGVIIVACKQNLSLDDDNSMAKIVLAVTAIMDEDERKRIKHRTANKKAWQREQIAKHGYFIIENGPNAGQKCTYVGSQKGHDTSAAREAAAANRLDAMILWREQSKGYNWVRTQLAKGKPRALILEEFNELHAADPDNYSTREGKPLSKGVLSKWCREINTLVA